MSAEPPKRFKVQVPKDAPKSTGATRQHNDALNTLDKEERIRIQEERRQANIRRRAARENLKAEIEAAKMKQQAAFKDYLETQAETAKLATLALEGRKSLLVQYGLANGMLTPAEETELERLISKALRSSGGVIRIESGDGK